MRVAAFDIGSNTLLMLVADAGEGGLTPVHDECRFGRLSEGLAATGGLVPHAVERCLDILRDYKTTLDGLGVERVGVVGTQAVRAATNAETFLAPAAEILGVPVEVISGEREAALTYRAASDSFPELAAETLVLADVGGASTEVVVGRGNQVESAISLPIGAVVLKERHLHGDPATADETRALFANIDGHLEALELPSGLPLIGTAGTATSFASVELRMATYQGDKVQGLRLTRPQVERHLARFLELSVAEKKKLVGLEPKRADVIAAGAAIYARLLARMNAPAFIISDRGVRFGVAAELATT